LSSRALRMSPMSARVDRFEDDASSILDRSKHSKGWHWWSRRRSRQERAAREASDLVHEFGKDAFWLACICVRRSGGAVRRHWQAVVTEIERGVGRTAAAMPSTSRTASSRRAANDQYFAPLNDGAREGYRPGADDHRRARGDHDRASRTDRRRD